MSVEEADGRLLLLERIEQAGRQLHRDTSESDGQVHVQRRPNFAGICARLNTSKFEAINLVSGIAI